MELTQRTDSRRWLVLAALLALSVLALAAIDRGGVARGRLQDVANLNVAGVDYDVSQATFMIDGVPGTQADLRLGQPLDIRDIAYPEDGNGQPRAGMVIFEDDVQGPLAARRAIENDPNVTFQLTVLGQRVLVGPDTEIDESLGQIEQLPLGVRLEISGYHGEPGEIRATRIDPAPPGLYELTGEVRVVSGPRLLIGAQLVVFSRAELIGFDGPPAAGDWVEAKGVTRGPALIALTVERKARALSGEELQEAELEGVITSFTDPLAFRVDDTPVTTTPETTYNNGSAEDLARGRLVEVEGELDEAGVLITARRIDFLDDDD